MTVEDFEVYGDGLRIKAAREFLLTPGANDKWLLRRTRDGLSAVQVPLSDPNLCLHLELMQRVLAETYEQEQQQKLVDELAKALELSPEEVAPQPETISTATLYEAVCEISEMLTSQFYAEYDEHGARIEYRPSGKHRPKGVK